MLKKIILTVIITLGLLGTNSLFAAAADSTVLNPPIKLKSEKKLRAVSFLVVNLLRTFHYSKKEINDDLSREFFKEYLNTLDPMHMFFLEPEVEIYREHYETKLDDMLLLQGGSDLSFAFNAYNKLNERMHEYYAFASQFADSPRLFNNTDTFLFDRKEVPFPSTVEAMHDIWAKRTLNEILIARIAYRADQEKKADTDLSKKVAWETTADSAKIKKRLKQVCTFFEGRTPLDVTEMYISAFARVFDPHCAYMAPKTEEQFNIMMGLQLVGIGAELTVDDGYIKINRIIPGGPADKCKILKVNDRIIAAAEGDAEPTSLIDMPIDKAVNYIRGKEKTTVTLTYLDGATGVSAAPQKLQLIREKVELKDAEAKSDTRIITDDYGKSRKIGIITLPSFYYNFSPNGTPKSSYEDVKILLEKLKTEGIDGLILDIRSNGGGALIDAIRISGLFLTQGTVVQIRDANGNIMPGIDDNPNLDYGGPLMLMVNKFSASASEIFAAAMQDYKRAVIVGDKQTHGKGTVQEVKDLNPYAAAFNLPAPIGSIKYTQAKFYRANGETTQLKGVVPDIIFPSFTDQIESGESSLEHALPFDTISSARLHSYIPNYDFVIQSLRRESGKRLAESEKFKILRDQIAYMAKQKERKSVSLNEKERWDLYKTEKEIADRQAELLKIDPETGADSIAVSDAKDIYMTECLKIMSDFCNLLDAGDKK